MTTVAETLPGCGKSTSRSSVAAAGIAISKHAASAARRAVIVGSGSKGPLLGGARDVPPHSVRGQRPVGCAARCTGCSVAHSPQPRSKMRGSACALLLTFFALPAIAKESQARFIRAADADTVLQPGDVMMKTLGPKTKITTAERAIEGGQKLVKKLSDDWFRALKVADVRLFHVAVYIGKGRTAEAHGGNLKTARVATRSIDDHAGYLFRVYRS